MFPLLDKCLFTEYLRPPGSPASASVQWLDNITDLFGALWYSYWGIGNWRELRKGGIGLVKLLVSNSIKRIVGIETQTEVNCDIYTFFDQ